MTLNEFSWVELIVFFRYQTFPILINLLLLSVWFPILLYYLLRKDNRDLKHLFLSLAFLGLFVKELFLFLFLRRIVFDFNLSRIEFSTLYWVAWESLQLYLFFFFVFKACKHDFIQKQTRLVLPIKHFLEEHFFAFPGMVVIVLLSVVPMIFFQLFPILNHFYPIQIHWGLQTLLVIYCFNKWYRVLEDDYGFLDFSWINRKSKLSPKLITGTNLFYLFQISFFLLIIYWGLVDWLHRLNLVNSNRMWFNADQLLEFGQTYLHGIKSLAYFFLVMILIRFVVNQAESDDWKKILQQQYLNQWNILSRRLEEEKLNYCLPQKLIHLFLDDCIEKFGAEFAFLYSEKNIFFRVDPQSDFYADKNHEEMMHLNHRQKYFPYLDIVCQERKKIHFVVDFDQKSKGFKEYYPFLMEELLNRDSLRVKSLINCPVYQFENGKQVHLGSCILINQMTGSRKGERWRLESLQAFLSLLVPTLVNLLDYYRKGFHQRLGKRNEIFTKKFKDYQNGLFQKIESEFDTYFRNIPEEVDLSFNLIDQPYPRFNFYSYIREGEYHFIKLTELSGEDEHLPTLGLILKNIFREHFHHPRKLLNRGEKLIKFLSGEVGVTETILIFDHKKKTLLYYLTPDHLLIVYRSENNQIELIREARSEWIQVESKTTDRSTDQPAFENDRFKEEGSPEDPSWNDRLIEGNLLLKDKDFFLSISRGVLEFQTRDQKPFDLAKLKKVLLKNKKKTSENLSQVVKDFLNQYPSRPLSCQVFLVGKTS